MNTLTIYNKELYHHGIQGQKWGVKNGPPYPLEKSLTLKLSSLYNKRGGIPSKHRKTVILPKAEYAKVMSEIATHASKEQKSMPQFLKSIGNYTYLVENPGDGTYRIIGKTKIK